MVSTDQWPLLVNIIIPFDNHLQWNLLWFLGCSSTHIVANWVPKSRIESNKYQSSRTKSNWVKYITTKSTAINNHNFILLLLLWKIPNLPRTRRLRQGIGSLILAIQYISSDFVIVPNLWNGTLRTSNVHLFPMMSISQSILNIA